MPSDCSYAEHGAERFESAVTASLVPLQALVGTLPPGRPGRRLRSVDALRPALAADGPVGAQVAKILGRPCRPVRATIFDKSPAANWSLGWHQDRTICVQRRSEVAGYGPWTRKDGIDHVEPPVGLLERMVTARLHLDDVSADNGPLLIAPGSHRFGRIAEVQIDEIVGRCGTFACTASAGDVWLYATPILHASRPAKSPTHRRVLQVDFAAEGLPGCLEWLSL